MNNPFQIVGSSGGEELKNEGLTTNVLERIKEVISSSDVVLFMKGNPDFPQCGFSANTVGILSQLNVKFKTYDILQDMELRSQLKEYSNWPTYPQLYFKGKLVGGNDIISEMFESGELKELFA